MFTTQNDQCSTGAKPLIKLLLPISAWWNSELRIKIKEYGTMPLGLKPAHQFGANCFVFTAMADKDRAHLDF